MTKSFLRRIFGAFVFLLYLVFDIPDIWKDECKTNNQLQFSLEGIKIKGDNLMAELREGQRIPVEAVLRTTAGNEATYQQDTARWSTTDESVARVDVNPDNPLKGYVVGVDGSENETVGVEFRCDGDPDEGETEVFEIVLSGVVTVTQGGARVGEISFGTAEDIEETPA